MRSACGKLCRELRVLRCCQALLEYCVGAREIQIPECGGVQPETGEAAGAEDPVASGFESLISGRHQFEPRDFPRAGNGDDILADSHALVQSLLCPEVARVAGNGHFDDQFRSACMIRTLDSRLSSVLRKNLKRVIWLRNIGRSHPPCPFEAWKASGCSRGVVTEPGGQGNVASVVVTTYGRGHIDDSVDQFRTFEIGYCLPAAKKLVARQAVAFEQRRRRNGSGQRHRMFLSAVTFMLTPALLTVLLLLSLATPLVAQVVEATG